MTNTKGKTHVTLIIALVVVAGLASLLFYQLVANDGGVYQAARHGAMTRLKMVLFFRPGLVNVRDRDQRTPLMGACYDGEYDAALYLIEKGADMDAQDSEGLTALHMGAIQGNMDIVQLLLAKGASPNVQDRGGMTPLMRMVQKGDLKMVRKLIDGKTDLDIADKADGMTALHWAASKGKTDADKKRYAEVARALLDGKANPNLRDKEGKTPLDAAFMNDNMPVHDLIKKAGGRSAVEDMQPTRRR